MSPPPEKPLEMVAAELDQAVHQQGVQALIGIVGLFTFVMGVLEWLGLRRQRDEVRAELVRRDLDHDVIDVEAVETTEAPWPVACADCGVVGGCVCVVPVGDD